MIAMIGACRKNRCIRNKYILNRFNFFRILLRRKIWINKRRWHDIAYNKGKKCNIKFSFYHQWIRNLSFKIALTSNGIQLTINITFFSITLNPSSAQKVTIIQHNCKRRINDLFHFFDTFGCAGVSTF